MRTGKRRHISTTHSLITFRETDGCSVLLHTPHSAEGLLEPTLEPPGIESGPHIDSGLGVFDALDPGVPLEELLLGFLLDAGLVAEARSLDLVEPGEMDDIPLFSFTEFCFFGAPAIWFFLPKQCDALLVVRKRNLAWNSRHF